MEIDLGFPALALVTTQDTAGIFRQASGILVSATKAMSISQGWAQYRVLQKEQTSLVLVLRGRRFLLFCRTISDRSFTFNMVGCHVRFERIFASKILLCAVAVTNHQKISI